MNLVKEVMDHLETFSPGEPFTIPESWQEGDAGAQGDLIIVVLDRVPDDWSLAELPASGCLVPGPETIGSRHCLASLDGVEAYTCDGVDGYVLRVGDSDVVIQHPKHGHWTIPAGRIVKIEYAREYDAEQRAARRSRD